MDRVEEIRKYLRFEHRSSEERSSVLEIINNYPDIFHPQNEHLPATNIAVHKIPTTDEQPINTRQYRFPPIHKEEMDKQVKQMLDAGIITHSSSPFNSPLWVVSKKPDSKRNKRWRLVIEFLCRTDGGRETHDRATTLIGYS